jgi:hypothetical protein
VPAVERFSFEEAKKFLVDGLGLAYIPESEDVAEIARWTVAMTVRYH